VALIGLSLPASRYDGDHALTALMLRIPEEGSVYGKRLIIYSRRAVLTPENLAVSRSLPSSTMARPNSGRTKAAEWTFEL